MFGTSGVRGEVGTDVTADLALAVGQAVASRGADRVVVGRDARESGALLADAVSAGLRQCGADAVRVGQVTTPTLARGVEWANADAGVMVTASHNPPADNGLKLWTATGAAFGAAERDEITRIVESEAYDRRGWQSLGDEETASLAERHRTALGEAVSLARPLEVVVDAGNGPGALTAAALDDMGCSVRTLNAQPDGSFPGRPSEPTADNCEGLQRLVAATDADLGVAHDGDADRAMAVTEAGEFVDGDALLALFGRAAASSGDRVAAPLNTSLAVDDALGDVGATVTRTRVGDAFVAERATEPDVAFGGEPSGAWIWPDETPCPDGPLAACRLAELVAAEGALSDLLDAVPSYPIERRNVETENKETTMAGVEERVLDAYDDVETTDGVRVETDEGWFLVRASGTEPLVRVTAEARDAERARDLCETATGLVTATTERPPSA